MQQRLRDLPSRVGVYFLLAMCLFPRGRCVITFRPECCAGPDFGGEIPVQAGADAEQARSQ